MSNIIELPQQDRRYDEASQWIARLDRQLSRAEVEALRVWMADDPANEATLLEMAKLWDKMDSLTRLSSLFPATVERRRVSPLYALAAAASVAVVAVGLWFAWIFASATDNAGLEQLAYQTAVGEQSTVTLQDGTQVVLNTNSLVTVNYTPDARLLTLTRGEIYVKVAKDTSRPLSVLAGEQIVQAVGTEFNVEIKSDQQIELVVREGKVLVGVRQTALGANGVRAPNRSLPPSQISPLSRTLVAGETLLMGSPEAKVEAVSAEEIEVKLSWQQGNLIFRGESLEEAVREVARYTSVEFVFLDDDLKRIRVAGLFRAGDVEGLLATLRENFNIVYQYTDEKKVELSASSN